MLVYTYAGWIPTYTKWLGILSLCSLNLGGLILLHCYYRMRNEPDYQPKFLYWLHVIMAFVMALLLLVLVAEWVLGYALLSRFSFKFLVWSWRDPPVLWRVAAVSACLGCTLPMVLGIRRVRVEAMPDNEMVADHSVRSVSRYPFGNPADRA